MSRGFLRQGIDIFLKINIAHIYCMHTRVLFFENSSLEYMVQCQIEKCKYHKINTNITAPV